MVRRNWNEEETLIALVLYYEIPFGKIDKQNQIIINVAQKLNRTPSALAMKMCNLARFDTTFQKGHGRGLPHGSKMDEYVWMKYANDFTSLAEVRDKLKYLLPKEVKPSVQRVSEVREGETQKALLNYRKGQSFFHAAVCNAYNYTCCITGITIPDLLIASHIKPWAKSDDKTEKANPRNGLCLNALHDKAFDIGLITIDKEYNIIVSEKLKRERYIDEKTKDWICAYEGHKIILPHRFQPNPVFIEYHNDYIFQK